MSSEALVGDLLVELFSVDELRRLMHRLPDGAALVRELPEGAVSPASMASATAAALTRHGAMPAAFAAMRAARERRVKEIDAVEAKWREEQEAQKPPKDLRERDPKSGPVRIAHLSDLHFKEDRRWDQDAVLKGLTRDLSGVAQQLGGLDLVCVTGDVAHAGKGSEYALAWEWINGPLREATGLPLERIRLVPGNHDVDRAKISRVGRLIVDGLLADKDLQGAVADVLGSPSERAPLMAPREAWMAFAQRFHGAQHSAPWWSERLELRGHRVHLAGLDSAWACTGGEDRGRLILSRFMCNQLLERADEADLVVALMHHPWDFFTERDGPVNEELVRRRAAVILHGHVHQQRTRFASDPDRQVLQLAAGACYAGSSWPNAWQALELDPARGEAKVHFRLWDGFDWIPDRNRFQAAPDGVATAPLRRRA